MKFEREEQLLKVISRQTLSRSDADWLANNIRAGVDLSVSIPRIIDEGLASFLFYHCRNLNLLPYLPESSRKLIVRIYQETFLINSHILRTLAELGQNLENYGIKIIVLKGAALLNHIYLDIGLRPMEDLDLMVRPQDLQDIKAILKAKGFRADRFYPNTFKRGIIHIDLHSDLLSSHRIQSRQRILNLQYEDVWQRSMLIEDYGTSIYRLALYDDIIAHAAHILKHGYRRMIWFVDIKESIESSRESFSWQELIGYCQQARAERLLLYFLLLAEPILGLKVDPEILDGLGKNDISTVEKQILRLCLTKQHPGIITEILWLFQIKNAKDKFQFIVENIFPQKQIMQQIFPSSSLSYTHFLHRFIDISLHILFDLSSALRLIVMRDLPRI